MFPSKPKDLLHEIHAFLDRIAVFPVFTKFCGGRDCSRAAGVSIRRKSYRKGSSGTSIVFVRRIRI
jgi:hypothetical protein